MGVETVLLYSLDKPEELDHLAEGIKQMWADALKQAGPVRP